MAEECKEALIAALSHPRFEVIPISGAEEQAGHLPRGAKVAVTCSPVRGIEHTLQHAEQLARHDLQVVPHISARLVVDKPHLRAILQRLADHNLRDIFVVGGDIKQPVGSFSSALDLLRAMADLRHNLDEIGVTAYPEHHPFIDDARLRQALADKQHYATYMVTQICFAPDVIVQWLRDARRQGITLPAYIGLPGVVDSTQLLRISMKIGIGASARFLSKHASLAANLLKPGHYRPTPLVEQLAPYFGDPWYNVQGLHINTFNQVQSSEKWRQAMLASIAALDKPAWRHDRSARNPNDTRSHR